jgi:hypothetical protein
MIGTRRARSGWLRIVAISALLVPSACTEGPRTDAVPTIASASRGSGKALLSWAPPRRNLDGSLLNDLAGYEIVYGTRPGELNRVIKVADPDTTSFTVDELTPGTYYFYVVAVTSRGVRSGPSATLSKIIP